MLLAEANHKDSHNTVLTAQVTRVEKMMLMSQDLDQTQTVNLNHKEDKFNNKKVDNNNSNSNKKPLRALIPNLTPDLMIIKVDKTTFKLEITSMQEMLEEDQLMHHI